jgi:hypothetical protein
MRIESGPAKADRNWQLVRVILFLGFAAYFVYDGAYGWPAKNAKEAKEQLAAPDPFNGELKYENLEDHPTKPAFEDFQRSNPERPEALHEALGEPELVRPDGQNRQIEYYVSQWGYGLVTIDRGRVLVSTMAWKPWYKTREEVVGQFYWAIVPALPGLYFLWRLYKAMTLRVVVDDQGLVYDGQRINYDQMVTLQDYNPKGWIDLYYRKNDKQARLRLDNEKFLRFDEVVAAICEQKGFRNEVAEFRAKQAAEEAEEAGAESDAVPESDAASDETADQPRG